MSFEYEDFRVVAPVDPYEGEWYVQLVRDDLDDVELDIFYKITAHSQDYYINPITDGKLN